MRKSGKARVAPMHRMGYDQLIHRVDDSPHTLLLIPHSLSPSLRPHAHKERPKKQRRQGGNGAVAAAGRRA